MKRVMKRGIVLLCVLTAFSSFAADATLEERLTALEEKFAKEASAREEILLNRISELEKQVQTLSEQVATVKPAEASGADSESLSTRVSAVEQEVAEMKDTNEKEFKLLEPLKGITIGGYGELHYNELEGSGGAKDKSEVDLHRFVVTVGKEFNEQTRFFSEMEIEHATTEDNKDGDDGYVVVEQAYVDFDLNEEHTARGGVFLVPVGLLNENHEPGRFYGVERNGVENQIIPTTWSEAGAGLHGLLSDTWRYDAYLHTGFDLTSTNYTIRNARQKGGYADSSDPAATAALNWSIPGVTIGGSSQYQQDMSSGDNKDNISAILGELHTDLAWRKWGFRALYAQWELDGNGPEQQGSDRQLGWYLEPSYKFTDKVGVFARYSEWNNLAGDRSKDAGKEQVSAGVNYYPHPQMVLKADYQWQFNEDNKDQDGVNLGMGYEF